VAGIVQRGPHRIVGKLRRVLGEPKRSVNGGCTLGWGQVCDSGERTGKTVLVLGAILRIVRRKLVMRAVERANHQGCATDLRRHPARRQRRTQQHRAERERHSERAKGGV